MASWAAASIPYFVYIGVLALVLPSLAPPARRRAGSAALFWMLLALIGGLTPVFWLRFLVLPLAVLLVAYWSSGLLWTGPMLRLERALARSDEALAVPHLSARMPRLLVELLEMAYVGVYPVIPIAFVLHLWYVATPDADRFWTVILATDFICFAMLPWIQTRPPRAMEPAVPWRSPLRTFNLGLLGRLSTGVNTVPSGHAAEALAAALLLSSAPPAVVGPMWVVALAISAGAVFGRYHYALDAVAGWLVALVVWGTFR